MNPKPVFKSLDGKAKILALYDAVLARWPVDHETFLLPTRHGETFVIASGEQTAPPLVLLHGAASNAVSWVGDIAEFSHHFRVYALDLPGEPGRSAENRPSWHGPDFAEWLEDVLRGLKVSQISLLGISQGGWTALRFATTHPECVAKLVLLASGGIVQTRPSFIFKAVTLSMFGRWGVDGINRLVNGKQPIHPEAQKFLEAIYTNFNTRVEKEYLFSDEELGHLNMPVMYIGGAQDALFDNKAAAERLQRLIPQTRVVMIPEMGHALINQAQQIVPFLLD